MEYLQSTYNLIASIAVITSGNLWDTPPEILINTYKQNSLNHRTYLISYLQFVSYSSFHTVDHSLTNNAVFTVLQGVYCAAFY